MYESLIYMHRVVMHNLFIGNIDREFTETIKRMITLKKLLLTGILALVILIPLTVQIAQASIGEGVLADVIDCDTGVSVPKTPDNLGAFVVIPGGRYRVRLTNIEAEFTSPITVYIKGKHTDGSSWIITLESQTITEKREIETDCFTIPSTAGCTIVVAYGTPGHLACDLNPPPQPGHMKTFYDDEPPFDNPVPCEAPGVPEFTLGSAIVVSLGLLAAYVVRRRQKML